MIWVYVLLVAGLLIYETVALLNRKEGDTISEIHWRLAQRYPVVPFAFGVLMGHFWWQAKACWPLISGGP